MQDDARPKDSNDSQDSTTSQATNNIVPPIIENGNTLVVDGSNPQCYDKPSAALKDAGPDDQVFVMPGVYEDRTFVSDRSIRLIGAGRDQVQIFSRRSSPLYLQRVPSGRIEGLTFRYVGSDQHSAMNILDSACTITKCRALEGILSGVVLYGPECRPTFTENEVCYNRESGIFSFAGARPYISQNACFGNHHFGIAVRDDGTSPDIVRNTCKDNMLSGILLFHAAKALILENHCHTNQHWGMVMTPDSHSSPEQEELLQANTLGDNPRGSLIVTHEPLAEIGR
ncbi:MAG: right-handed parallel beta-helix repeat-containing protein [Nitrospirales bacterium]